MTGDDDDLTPERLREEQTEKARDERKHAEEAATDDDAATHDRRSEKAAYLASRLAERERSEHEAGEDEEP